MNWLECMIIILGVSLDIFAAMECQGALVAKINKQQLSGICVIITMWQLAALFMGNGIAWLIRREQILEDERVLGQILAIGIFAGLGIRLLMKALRDERIVERRENKQDLRRFIHMALGASIYTILAGVAIGFLEGNLWMLLIMVVLFSVLFIIGGMYTGYHLGFEQKTKAYVLGTIFFWMAGLDVLIRFFVN